MLGAVTGRVFFSQGRAGVEGQGMPTPQASQAATTVRPLATAGELVKASREKISSSASGERPHADLVASWTTEEIHAALDESLTNKDFLLKSNGAHHLALTLLVEWLKRDCDAAVAWFVGIKSSAVKTDMIMQLSYYWPPEQAEKGVRFIIDHPELLNGSSGWSIISKAIIKQAENGPEAVIGVLRELREGKVGVDFDNTIKFPESFDFATLMRSDEVRRIRDAGQGRALIRAWHAQDREAAFQWLLENEGGRALHVITSSPEGEVPGNLKWIGGKYSSLDATQRAEFRNGIEPGYVWGSDRVLTLSASAGDASSADELRGVAAQFVYAGRMGDAIAILAEVPDATRRLEILENATPQGDLAKNHRRKEFTPEDEARLRKQLADWNAPDSRIETIISKFKP